MYVFQPGSGAQQLTVDDIRDRGDAMANLREDSVVSNAMSADTDFVVHHRKVELTAPFLMVAATDGCFGYVPSPMHFEHLVLAALRDAGTPTAGPTAMQAAVSAVTGDDAAMATLGVGADHDGFRELFARRTAELEQRWIAPLDDLDAELREQERKLEELRTARRQRQAQLWAAYKPGYEELPSTAARQETSVRAGDTVQGYRLLEDFRVVGAGLSEWTFAERDGRIYFIKRFLAPTYPDDAAPGSAKTKAQETCPLRGVRGAPPRHPGGDGAADQLRRQPHRHPGLLPRGREVLQGHREGGPRRAGAARRRGAGFPRPAGAAQDRRAQPEDPARPRDRAQRPQAEQRPDQTHRARLHHQAHRLRQLLRRRQPAAAGGDRRHDELLLT